MWSSKFVGDGIRVGFGYGGQWGRICWHFRLWGIHRMSLKSYWMCPFKKPATSFELWVSLPINGMLHITNNFFLLVKCFRFRHFLISNFCHCIPTSHVLPSSTLASATIVLSIRRKRQSRERLPPSIKVEKCAILKL